MLFDKGVYTVIPTPFKVVNETTEVDFESLYKIIDRQLVNETKVNGIVLLGTTSETPTLTEEERHLIAKTVYYKYSNDINIIVGIGGNDTMAVINEGYKLKDYCQGFMITVPYYNKPTQEGIYQHFSFIVNKFTDKEFMLYNVPSRTGVNMESATTIKLANNHNNIKAIKEASGKLDQVYEISQNTNLKVYSGDDIAILQYSSLGACGVVSVASNIEPKLVIDIVNYCNNNDFRSALQLYPKLEQLAKILFITTNPVPLKVLLSKLNCCEQEVRLPLTLPDTELINKIEQVYDVLNENI